MLMFDLKLGKKITTADMKNLLKEGTSGIGYLAFRVLMSSGENDAINSNMCTYFSF